MSVDVSLNIDIDNVSAYCDLKCSFSFKYQGERVESISNNGDHFKFTLETINQPSVLFNNEKYKPVSFYIYNPSIHYFKGSNVAAELIINHIQQQNGSTLAVCIPIILNATSSSATDIITELIDESASIVPGGNSSYTFNDDVKINFQGIVPNRPFYTYKKNNNYFIVFDKTNAITIRDDTKDKLNTKLNKSIPAATTNEFKYEVGKLYYNSKGPSKNDISDGIYISCRPTGSSVEDTPVVYDKQTYAPSFFTMEMFESKQVNQLMFIFINCILFVILLYFFNFLYGYLTTDKTSKEYFASAFSFSRT